ncbi:MAG: flagellar hook protein FlgE [Porticoccus sp.]|nr:flagellar hook protein FlgE [Porticoccus sp.]MBQ0807751.1 flagellar hook protein FlgE [Porticoccus sp.]
MGFSQALSGLNAAATNLEVIGNNIANSQTVGFKGGRTLFSDVFAEANTALGTRVSDVQQDFTTGTLESTGRNLDLAISGEGFFRMVQNDQVVYSRNGQLTIDSDGYFTNAQGAHLTGFAPGGAGGSPIELQLGSGGLPAQATTSVGMAMNLDARAVAVDRLTVPFDAADETTYSYSHNATIYDSQGNAHSSTLYFTKTADNAWEVKMSRGTEVAPETGTLTFDTNGILVGTAGLGSFTYAPGGGVSNMDMSLDLTDATQFATEFDPNAVDQDGYTSGNLVGVLIDDSGNIVGNYANQQTQVLGTILLAKFTSPEGLRPIGDNAWSETGDSGQPLLGLAGTGVLGSLEAGVVESSNVDLTKELVNLIIAQRNYQANTQTIKVQDEVLQAAVNL